MSDVDVTIRAGDVARIIKKLETLKPAGRNAVLSSAWRRGTLFMENQLKQAISGPILKVRTGHLRNSIGSQITFETGRIKSVIGSGARTGRRLPYANIHETGGVIRPKRGKYLAIPIGNMRTAAGVGKMPARDFFRANKSSAFIVNGIVYNAVGKTGISPSYVLKRSVTIPARHYMSLTVQKFGGNVVKIVEDWVNRAVEAK